MKRKILLIAFIFMFIPKVKAECIIEEKIDIGYMEKNDAYIIDDTDYKINYKDWSLQVPNSENYEVREMLYYREVKPIRYIHLYNFAGDGVLHINEIIVKKNGVPLMYSAYCESCSPNFEFEIQDGDVFKGNPYIDLDGYIRIDLNSYYSIGDLTIELYITDFSNKEKKYEISTTHDETLDHIYTNILEKMWFTHKNYNEYIKREWSLSNILYVNPEYTDYMPATPGMVPTKYREVSLKSEFREEVRLYKHYENVVNQCPEIPPSEPVEEPKPVIPKPDPIEKEDPVVVPIEPKPVENNNEIESVQEEIAIPSPLIEVKKETANPVVNINNKDVKEPDESKEKVVEKVVTEIREVTVEKIKVKNNFSLVIILLLIIIIRGMIDVKNKCIRK